MIKLKTLKVDDILHWSLEGDHMLGKVVDVADNSVKIIWYYDSDDSAESQQSLGEPHTVDIRSNHGWMSYTDIITEEENLIFLLSHK
jgi:hypothetical protein